MTKLVRPVLLVVAAIQLFFAVVFYFQWPLAVNIWPSEGTTPLTYIFIASIFAAAGASTLWAILSGNDAAVAGIALDYIVIFAPMGLYVARLAVRDGNAGGQLAGFLAYDIVLIVPFLQRLPTVAPEHRIGLYLYTAVVTYSGLLAIYYLFVHRRTRVRSTPAPTAA